MPESCVTHCLSFLLTSVLCPLSSGPLCQSESACPLSSVSSPLSVCLPSVLCPQCQFSVLCPLTDSLLSSVLCQSPAQSSVPGVGTEVFRRWQDWHSGGASGRMPRQLGMLGGGGGGGGVAATSGSIPIFIRRHKKKIISGPLHRIFFLRTEVFADKD